LISNLISVDPASSTRSYAGTAYYRPNAGRPNLTVLTQAQVSKITFAHRYGKTYATGADFIAFGSPYHVEADHEVLLCCGSLQSPQILELSGIGSKKILEKLDIDVVVENPNVGENLQDHGIVPISYAVAEGAVTFDSLSIAGAEAAAEDEFFGNQNGLLSSLINSNANLSYQQVDHRVGHVSTESISQLTKAATIDAPPSLKKQYELLGESLLNPKDSAYQVIYIPAGIEKGFADGEGTPAPGSWFSFYVSVSRPYSRGNVHATSKDPTVAPLIDPNYLSHPLDVELFSDGVLFIQDLATKEPLASKLKDGGHAFHPGFSHLTKETVGEFCKEALTSEYHPVGSCAMMPEKDGGVVDPKLRVYGVQNLRVVDASIFPMEIRNNLQTSVYAVAEKAADIIKADWKDAKEVFVKNGKRGFDGNFSPKQNGKKAKRS
jgi:choline dehydrogenase